MIPETRHVAWPGVWLKCGCCECHVSTDDRSKWRSGRIKVTWLETRHVARPGALLKCGCCECHVSTDDRSKWRSGRIEKSFSGAREVKTCSIDTDLEISVARTTEVHSEMTLSKSRLKMMSIVPEWFCIKMHMNRCQEFRIPIPGVRITYWKP